MNQSFNHSIKDNTGATPLSYFLRSQASDKDTFDLLLASGADVNARDLQGRTPLLYSILSNSFAAAPTKYEWLLQAGAGIYFALMSII